MRKLFGLLPAFALVAGVSQDAHAAEVTRVASSFDQDFNGNAFDLHFGVSYDFDFKKAAIMREWNSGNRNNIARDLIYRQFRHTVTPMLEIGLWHDISVYLAMPVVVSDNRNYSFDQEADCVFPRQPGAGGYQAGSATCVDKTNSTSINDGIIPRNGFDAFEDANPFGQFTDRETDMIFRAPTRRGLDQLHVGLKIGILSQDRKSHLPNWVVGLEGRFAIAKPMGFSRAIQTSDPSENHRVGRGMHELGAWTALSRSYRWLDPFFGAHWRYAFASGSSNFINHGGTQNKVNPQSETGAYFGTEIVAWENKDQQKKAAFVLAGTATLHYGGRAYSEVWELLADSPAMVGDYSPGVGSGCPNDRATSPAINAALGAPLGGNYVDPANATMGAGDCAKFNGITAVQDYGSFSVNAGLNFHMGPYARLNFGVDLRTDTRHFVTSDRRGDPSLGGDLDTVDEPNEVNPMFRPIVNNAGRRYLVDDVFNVNGYFNFIVTF